MSDKIRELQKSITELEIVLNRIRSLLTKLRMPFLRTEEGEEIHVPEELKQRVMQEYRKAKQKMIEIINKMP